MLFNSLAFLIFLPVVFLLYWFVFNKNLKLQNLLILISSYVFYGWWNWRFLSLIAISTIVDYIMGFNIQSASDDRIKKRWLWLSIAINLGILGFFKYFNFFIDSWIDLLGLFGYEITYSWTLNIILPVGISFYTFQTMSYTIDVYRGKLIPTRDFISFASFVSFFPQLVAGPIERATNLLPQMLNTRFFSYEKSIQGLRLILWGMFKKVVIADNLAPFVDGIFGDYQELNGGVLVLGAIYFSLQIYCDFSGYSDIAIGVSKLFGFELMSNFKFPFFSRNVAEFWRRWHISLSTWFRDYVYIPLGGSRGTQFNALKNIFIIFLVSGFWHGAKWTFIIWGLVHALMYIPLFLGNTNRKYLSSVAGENTWFPSLRELWQMGTTWFFVLIGWVFFRSDSVGEAFQYLIAIPTRMGIPDTFRVGILYVIGCLIMEWMMRRDERNPILTKYKIVNWIMYIALLYLILTNMDNRQSFIYFQF
ncbi:MAG: MBOAT family O-acyltransferase [Bacteroidota bacterium]